MAHKLTREPFVYAAFLQLRLDQEGNKIVHVHEPVYEACRHHKRSPLPRRIVARYHRPGRWRVGDPAPEFAQIPLAARLPYALGVSHQLTVFRGTPAVHIPPSSRTGRPRSQLMLVHDTRPITVRAVAG